MKFASATLSPLALAAVLGACAPVRPSLVAPDSVRSTWQASERALRSVAAHMPALAVPTPGHSFDTATLRLFDTTFRHPTGETRRLGRYDSVTHTVISDGPVATIHAVRAIEYKTMADLASPLPVAIIDLVAADSYPKLGLKAGRNYWIVQQVGGKLVGWIQNVPLSGALPAPRKLNVELPKDYDAVEPGVGAHFVWSATDETLWAWCGGKCCRAISAQ